MSVDLPGITPWVGTALRHIPAHSNRDILDFELAGIGPFNRWNDPGQRTLYLAGDRGVLVAEWGRHLDPRFPTDVISDTFSQRDVFLLKMRLDRVLDVRDPDIANAVHLSLAPEFLLDIYRTRVAAHWVRTQTPAQAMLVPSVAFLDDFTRWNLVIFLEKVANDPANWITAVTPGGPLHWQ